MPLYKKGFIHRERVQRPASATEGSTSTSTPATWAELPSNQEGRFDRPGIPRMSGAMCVERGSGNCGVETPTSYLGCYLGWDDQVLTSRPSCFSPISHKPVAKTIMETVEGTAYGREEEERAVSNRRWLNGEDAVVGESEADAPNDWDTTWEQCGLSGGKAARKVAPNPPIYGNNESSVNDYWGRRDSPAGQTASQFNLIRSTCQKETSGHNYQRSPTVGGNWNTRSITANDVSRGTTPHNNGGHGSTRQNIRPQHGEKAKFCDSSSASVPYQPPERKLGSRVNPDNYDGNRAGPDGSRVFYSAILPTVPTLQDIANHAEYTAWFDMLRSILKYHQLAAVIASDANRPHSYKDGRRWDQDRLRAAIIIKGALSFDVFERVRRNGWKDTENPTETVEKVKETHGAVCPCGHSQGMTLLDF